MADGSISGKDTRSIELSSTQKGRHAELLAQTALLANGWTVSEPISPEAFDMSIKRADDKRTYYVQCKTVMRRNEERYNGEWLIVKGTRNNGQVYRKDEVDFFVAILNGDVYMFPNRQIGEYWVRPWEIDDKWTTLSVDIHNTNNKSEAK